MRETVDSLMLKSALDTVSVVDVSDDPVDEVDCRLSGNSPVFVSLDALDSELVRLAIEG